MPRLYTVDEANALLPELTGLLAHLQLEAETLSTVQAAAQEVHLKIQSNGYGLEAEQLAGQAAAAERELRQGLARLRDLNIELKDLQTGLLDFYHERAGRLVYLCWRCGEPAVAYWHDLDTGFSGRQPL